MKRTPGLVAALALCLGGGAAAPVPAVHLDQVGFLPGAAKLAIVALPAATTLPWRLIDDTGKVALTGRTVIIGDDPASGDRVQRIDFTAAATPGHYWLVVDGVARARVTIGDGVFHPLALAALNYFYQSRSGIAIEARFAGGPAWARAAGHPRERVACFTGADLRGTAWPGCSYRLDVTGGWYDAGDQGKYVVNGGIAVWTLQNLYEAFAPAHPFPDGSAMLPEAGNGVDDLLDEARWEMRFLLAMQVPDGARLALPVEPQPATGPLRLSVVDAGGMAHHKVADRNWTPLPTAPAEDHEERLLYPPNTAATLNLAATAAQCARVWRRIDDGFADRCEGAAVRAYSAALRNPAIRAAEGFGGSGGYGDDDLSDEFYWATAELYALEPTPALAAALHRMTADNAPLSSAPSWGSTAAMGAITLATAPGVDTAVRDAARARLVMLADRYVAAAANSGYGVPLDARDYGWGSNGELLNRGIVLALAARFTGVARYRTAAIATVDYVLGRNALDQSYVSGFGIRPMRNPHHRFWTHQLDPRMPGPPPGVASGGANATSFADPVSATLKGRCAPQRCWIDDARAYADNEVAINWNAPLLWMAAWMDRGAR